ncbi:MAG: glycerol-3-phosphate 1-O-acyltransferase PlsY [Elusimicrobia bacterium]|nr:glycerol-3-phosphate 1-O-acyltransferase PlsY [Elusimicrobiota bacterium]
MDFKVLFFAVFSYLLGGIPSGYLIAKYLRGIDIREYGSGNPGAANVYRVVGKWAGWATMGLDTAKGFIPVMMARWYYGDRYDLLVSCGALAIFGHIWTIFLKFRGGKGVATSAGVFAALLPLPTFLTFLVFITAVALSGHISVGSILAAVAMPFLSLVLNSPAPLTLMSIIISGLVLFKHIPNMRRLFGGKELFLKNGR